MGKHGSLSPAYCRTTCPVTYPHNMRPPHQDTKGHRTSGMEKRRPRTPGCPRPAARLRQFVPYACSGPFPLLARRRTGVLPHQKETSVLPPVLTSCRDGHAGTAGSPAPSFPRPRNIPTAIPAPALTTKDGDLPCPPEQRFFGVGGGTGEEGAVFTKNAPSSPAKNGYPSLPKLPAAHVPARRPRWRAARRPCPPQPCGRRCGRRPGAPPA